MIVSFQAPQPKPIPNDPWSTYPIPPEVRADLYNGQLSHMIGELGTQTPSQTLWEGARGFHLDVINPAPGKRPGIIHLQKGKGKNVTTWKFNPCKGIFEGEGMSKHLNQRLLKNQELRKSIEKGMRKYLGESTWDWPS